MDSPDRNQFAATPLSKFEDSPFFNFLNNLSPIQPVKSVHSIHAETSPGFSSISSVFSSPHISLPRESRFLIRPPYLETSKQYNSSEGGVPVSNYGQAIKCSLNEAAVDPPDDCPALTSRLPESVQYDCGSPDHNIAPCYGVKLDLNLNVGCAEDTRKSLFADDIVPATNVCEPTKEAGSGSGSDWENIIYPDAGDLLIFDDPMESVACEGEDEDLGDKDASFGLCLENNVDDPPDIGSEDVGENGETDHIPQVFVGACQDQAGVSNPCLEAGDGTNGCVSLDCKDSQQQRGIRRRCLVFEVSGANKGNSQNDSNHPSSDSMPSSRKVASTFIRPLASLKPGDSPSLCVMPGIGLHLNSLASNSRDRTVTQEASGSGKRKMSTQFSADPFPPRSGWQKSLSQSLTVEKDQDPILSEAQDYQIVLHDASMTPELGSCEELSQSSPKKKRRKSDGGAEGEGCKRCNCKKSKCLKLYCECFAAGVYCIESCSCQGCYNKPIHEETVLATRKQIETRNPLAFAPKVIRTTETVQDMGEETNNTPASARHKRGCNCKKSSCLKKYCECYQGGVGCSISCRCEGCKNAFGRKDGVASMSTEEVEPMEEEVDACGKERCKPEDGQASGVVQKDPVHIPESISLTTPLQNSRTSANMLFCSSQKPPRSSTSFPLWNASQMHRKPEMLPFPEGEFGIQTPENNCVKTASPNSKRVSPPQIGVRLSPSGKGGRKLILKSIPSFPPLNSDATDRCVVNQSSAPH